MQFSDATNKLGLIQMCEDLTGIGDGNITGTPLLRFTRWINQWNRKVWYWIFDSYGGWQYDDSNETDLPSATTTITASQKSYGLPADALTLKGIEVKNSGNVWQPLLPITDEQIRTFQAETEFYKTAGQPLYFRLVGDSIILYPASNYTQAASLKVYYDRTSVDFASTATTAVPGFAIIFHEVLALGAALEYLKIHQPADARTTQIAAEIQAYEVSVRGFYQQRFKSMYPPKMSIRDSLREFI